VSELSVDGLSLRVAEGVTTSQMTRMVIVTRMVRMEVCDGKLGGS
jgi:hypothetical protein